MGACMGKRQDPRAPPTANTAAKSEQKAPNYKVILTGNTDVGKTSLILRLVTGKASTELPSNADDGILTHDMQVDGKPIKLSLFDTQGQEKFRTITSSSYDGTSAIMLVFDITNKQTFEDLHQWITEADRYAKTAAMILVGNKSDKSSTRAVTADEAKEFAESKGWRYFDVSAESGENVTEAFQALVKEISDDRYGDEAQDDEEDEEQKEDSKEEDEEDDDANDD